jgi:hypothetical protein
MTNQTSVQPRGRVAGLGLLSGGRAEDLVGRLVDEFSVGDHCEAPQVLVSGVGRLGDRLKVASISITN